MLVTVPTLTPSDSLYSWHTILPLPPASVTFTAEHSVISLHVAAHCVLERTSTVFRDVRFFPGPVWSTFLSKRMSVSKKHVVPFNFQYIKFKNVRVTYLRLTVQGVQRGTRHFKWPAQSHSSVVYNVHLWKLTPCCPCLPVDVLALMQHRVMSKTGLTLWCKSISVGISLGKQFLSLYFEPRSKSKRKAIILCYGPQQGSILSPLSPL